MNITPNLHPEISSRWSETYEYVRLHSPYYRELFKSCSQAPQLNEIPLLTKQILSERNNDFLCVPPKQVVEMVTTSGTTGHPLIWMLTEKDLNRLAQNEMQSFGCAGVSPEDIVLIAVGMDRCFIAGLAYWLGLRMIGCGVSRVGASSPKMILDMIRRLHPTVIVGVPSFLAQIQRAAQQMNLDLADSSIQKAICIGEPIRNSNLTLTGSSRRLQESWGAHLYSTYGVTELASSLCECDAGQGGHLHQNLLHLEVLDDRGNPVEEGATGEIVATTFGVEAMPVLRYRTGDCAAYFSAPCPCGRTSPRIGPVLGRLNHRLKVKGVSLFPSTLQRVLDEKQDIESYVILIQKDTHQSDLLDILIAGTINLDDLREELRASCKVAPRLRQAPLEEIRQLRQPEGYGKVRYFVDQR